MCSLIVLLNSTKIMLKFHIYRLLGDLPNTYTYSKALGEELVKEYMDKLPIIVVRPSVGKFNYIYYNNFIDLCRVSNIKYD